MKQKIFPHDATPQPQRLDGDGGSGFSWNGIIDSVFGNAGGILNGVGSIVGAANTKTTTTYNYNKNENAFSFTNGTTITALVIGGVAIIVTIILVLKK